MLNKVDPITAKAWIEDGKAVLIDVRDAEEHAREHLPDAFPLPLAQLDGIKVPRDHRLAVFYCASGAQSRKAAARLAELGFGEAYLLDGGLAAWKKAGLNTQVDRGAPISLRRQVPIAAGVLVLLGLLLGWLVSPSFVLVSALVGVELIVSGLWGYSLLTEALALLPHNRDRHDPQRSRSGEDA